MRSWRHGSERLPTSTEAMPESVGSDPTEGKGGGSLSKTRRQAMQVKEVQLEKTLMRRDQT